MTKTLYGIFDWCGNRVYPDHVFICFYEAWDFIYEKFPNFKENDWDDFEVLEL